MNGPIDASMDSTANRSFNQALDYYIDSLTGRSQRTKDAYEKDLVQLKLYLVLFRRHLVIRGSVDDIAELESELKKSDGKLTDTRYLERHYRTQVRSKTLLDRFDLGLDLFRKEDIVGYFGYLESTKSLARSTLLRRLAALRSFFNLISKDGFSVNPEILERLADMDIRRDRKLPVALEQDEALNFLRVIQDPRDRAMVLIMLFMGLRISEVVQLNVDDITNDTDGITLLGKGGKERFVPVHPQVKSAVALYKSVRPEVDRDTLGEPMFVSKQRRRIDPSTVRHLIKKYANQSEGIESRKKDKLSPHKLRHTFATLLLQGEVDIRHIQELLGHENLATTEIYTHVNRRDLRAAIDQHPLSP